MSHKPIGRAFIVVDIQNDFLPGGALAVSCADQVIAPINRLIAERARLFSCVVATQDWHPENHESFASQHRGLVVGQLSELHGRPQVMWPDHCVQGSFGARIAAGLSISRLDHIVTKGSNAAVDSYSGFFDNDRCHETGLHAWLIEREITSVAVAGLATDYCVKFTVLDALSLGYKVTVITDAVRGVNLQPNDSDDALNEMARAGAKLACLKDIWGGFS